MPNTGQTETDAYYRKFRTGKKLGLVTDGDRYTEFYASKSVTEGTEPVDAGRRARLRVVYGDKIDTRTGDIEKMRETVDRPRRAAMAKALRGG